MLTDQHILILTALLREAGAGAVVAADSLLEAPPEKRPVLVAEAIALHGRDREGVRMLVRGLGLGNWIEEEVSERLPKPNTPSL